MRSMVSPLACDCFSRDLGEAEVVDRRYSSPDGRRSVTRVTVAGTEARPPKAHAYNSAVMTRRFQLALLLGLLTVLPDTAQTAPIDAKQAPIVIQHDGSEGDVRVNGVLILHFSSDPNLGNGSLPPKRDRHDGYFRK